MESAAFDPQEQILHFTYCFKLSHFSHASKCISIW